jgi:hypothetical protein
LLQRTLFLLVLLSLPPALRAAGPINGDFESGSLSPWNVNLTSSGIPGGTYYPYARTVTAGPAPNTNGNLNMVNGGTFSCELYSGQGDTGHYDAASISQSFTVDPLNTFMQFNVAAVLDGSHASTPSDDAFFEVVIYNAGGAAVASGFIAGSVSLGGVPLKTGVVIVASTATIVTPPTINAATLMGTGYFLTSSYENGSYVMEVRGSTSTSYNVYAYYPTYSAGVWTNTVRSSTSVSVLPGFTKSGVSFTW